MALVDPKPGLKRKLADDPNSLLAAATKRMKKEANSGASKRKHIGEVQPGGLVIVRAPVQRAISPLNPPSSSSQPLPATTSQPPSRPPSSHSQPLPSTSNSIAPGPSKPLSKKFRADSSRAPTSAKSREVLATTREEPELDEDIRQMESETDHLRSRSRAKEAAHPSFQLPPTASTPSRRHPPDALQPLPESETPQIERNKLMREGPSIPRTPQTPATSHSRRTSMSMRGKRISNSFENTGVISQPHASVNDSSFYKHIDCDLPEPQRARQLLVWSAARAASRLSEPSSSAKPLKPPSKSSSNHGKDPPPLDDRKKQILKIVQEDFIRMLAEKKIDTSVYGHGENGKAVREGALKPNEQNVKNRVREVTFQQHINRAQAESEAWSRVDQFYHQYEASSKADLEKRRQALRPPSSANAKGKQRATSQEPQDDWLWLVPREGDLSDGFRDKIDLELIKQVMSSEPRPGNEFQGPLDEKIGDLQFKADNLYSYVNSAVQAIDMAEAELDYRFSLLSLALSARSHTLPPPSNSLASYLPRTQRGSSHPPGESPRDILRALSRIDKERPPGKIGDAARRAVREVQRVQVVGSGGVGERRITELGPGVGATPRKVPGTPRRRER
ncbi:Mis12-Mtw1 protein family-domain-containing protein [Boletus reticuloceps]|uniref:Mis12-Mtw1 protein family-domain-containing protein n=1 Tax=Boletus reticuloceps TaxID=495285 RepID=A0A8I2YM80_9AGAM|nr:Mis12-Mtw1 protein family-domain-containing protein [Boletus reticuloceps]